MMSRLHTQLCKREWVLWGHGPRRANEPRFPCMVSPAAGFRLPKLGNPCEHERVTMWGWRFRSDNELDSTAWQLADSREECLRQAKARVRDAMEHEPRKGRAFAEALGDVREYERGLI